MSAGMSDCVLNRSSLSTPFSCWGATSKDAGGQCIGPGTSGFPFDYMMENSYCRIESVYIYTGRISRYVLLVDVISLSGDGEESSGDEGDLLFPENGPSLDNSPDEKASPAISAVGFGWR